MALALALLRCLETKCMLGLDYGATLILLKIE